MSKILRYAAEFLLLILLAAAAIWVNSGKGAEPAGKEVPDTAVPAKYVAHIDGDTTIFSTEEGEVRVRYLAIDTPESVSRDTDRPNTDMGVTVSEYVKQRLEGAEHIYLEYDEESEQTDKYGRTLAWIWVDGVLFQRELVEKGYAEIRYVYGNYKYLDELYSLQEQAREKKLGIWAEDPDVDSSLLNTSRAPAYNKVECLMHKEF